MYVPAKTCTLYYYLYILYFMYENEAGKKGLKYWGVGLGLINII